MIAKCCVCFVEDRELNSVRCADCGPGRPTNQTNATRRADPDQALRDYFRAETAEAAERREL